MLLVIYEPVEAPLSGMSMNPARTFGSALPAGVWNSWWVYFTAPPLAMLAAAEVVRPFARDAGGLVCQAPSCGKRQTLYFLVRIRREPGQRHLLPDPDEASHVRAVLSCPVRNQHACVVIKPSKCEGLKVLQLGIDGEDGGKPGISGRMPTATETEGLWDDPRTTSGLPWCL